MAESQDRPTRGPGLVVRLRADERDAWHAAARSAGYRQTAVWVREIIAARLAAGASNRPASKAVAGSGGVPVEVLAALGRIGSNVNQLAHRANAAALNSEPFPVTVAELEGMRRELAGVREALDGDRDLLAAGEREAIEARVRAEVLAEVEAELQRRWDELVARARASKTVPGPGEVSARLEAVLARLHGREDADADEDDEGWGSW